MKNRNKASYKKRARQLKLRIGEVGVGVVRGRGRQAKANTAKKRRGDGAIIEILFEMYFRAPKKEVDDIS